MKVSKLSVLPLFFALSGLASMTADAEVTAKMGIGNHAIHAVVDTGATYSMIPKHMVKPGMLVQSLGSQYFDMADGHRGEASIYEALISIGGLPAELIKVAVVPGAKSPLMGMNVLKKFRASVNASSGRLEFPANNGDYSRPTFQYEYASHPQAPRSNPVFKKPYVETRDPEGHVTPACN